MRKPFSRRVLQNLTGTRKRGHAGAWPSKLPDHSHVLGGSRSRATAARVAGFLTVCLVLAVTGCAGSGPRVLEVSGAKRVWTVDPVHAPYFSRDRASNIQFRSKKLPGEQQCQEFFVRWTPRTIGLVKFEYRQVKFPDQTAEQSFVPDVRHWRVFQICGTDFQEGGAVSAWRVTLWRDDAVVAERKSALW